MKVSSLVELDCRRRACSNEVQSAVKIKKTSVEDNRRCNTAAKGERMKVLNQRKGVDTTTSL